MIIESNNNLFDKLNLVIDLNTEVLERLGPLKCLWEGLFPFAPDTRVRFVQLRRLHRLELKLALLHLDPLDKHVDGAFRLWSHLTLKLVQMIRNLLLVIDWH